MVLHNVENLRWQTRQSLDQAFRRVGRQLDERVEEVIAAAHGPSRPLPGSAGRGRTPPPPRPHGWPRRSVTSLGWVVPSGRMAFCLGDSPTDTRLEVAG